MRDAAMNLERRTFLKGRKRGGERPDCRRTAAEALDAAEARTLSFKRNAVC